MPTRLRNCVLALSLVIGVMSSAVRVEGSDHSIFTNLPVPSDQLFARSHRSKHAPEVASTLIAGDIAIVGYNAATVSVPGATDDSFAFVVLRPIGSGTQIFFSDRNWTGSAFPAAGGGDGTYTYSAGADIAAGTVIQVTTADLTGAGINLSNTTDTGDTLYAYQGSINTPTTFLYAIDLADGNTTFNGTLTGTGLTAGTNAVAIAGNNANFGGPAFARPANTGANLLADISDFNSWASNENSPQTMLSGPFLLAADRQLWVAASGAGNAVVNISADSTVGSSLTGINNVQQYQNSNGITTRHPSDIALDTVHDKYFLVDADLAGHNRILQGTISAVLNNPGVSPTFTVLYSNTDSGATNSMRTLSIDVQNGIVYFDLGTTFAKVLYNTPNQTPTVLANLGTGGYITQMTIDYAHGEVYLANSRVVTFFGLDVVEKNYIYRATGLTSSSSSLTFAQIPFNPDDNDNASGSPSLVISGEAFPVENGTVRGIDIDPVTRTLYIATGTNIYDTSDGNGTSSTTFYGGVYSYATQGNPNGNFTMLFTQDSGTNNTKPRGLLYYIDVDPVAGRYYVVDENGSTTPDPTRPTKGVWTGSTSVAATPTFFASVNNINGIGPQGLDLDTAPTLSVTTANPIPVYTEQPGSPSLAGPAVSLITSPTAADVDTTTFTDQLAGATVRISNNFVAGDSLTFTNGGGVTGSYNSATGVLTFSGISTFTSYQTALASVKFTNAGDNPSDYGNKLTRTLSWSVNDGLLSSDEQTSSLSIDAVNDAPVNNGISAKIGNEDTNIPITGLTITDVDADPANQAITTTMSVTNGTLTFRTDVASGLVAGDITANGTNTVVVTATQNKINATLGNGTGLQYKGAQDYFGPDTLHIVTNDNSHTPTPAQTATNDLGITVNSVNDVPSFTKGGDQTVLEDSGSQGPTAWATAISFGPANEAPQAVDFIVTNNNNPLFSAQPAISPTGNLTYTPAANANGSATVSVKIHDDGGVLNGGVDTSAIQTFTINVTAVNDKPTFTAANPPTVLEDAGAQTVTTWVTNFNPGPANESSQTVISYTVSNVGNPGLFSSAPAVATNGTLTYTPAVNANGTSTFDVKVQDNGGTANSGVDTSDVQTFTITVTAVNDAPVLDATKTPVFNSELEDAALPVGPVGTPISNLVDFAAPSGQVDNVTDVDANAVTGIAVTAANAANGVWYYSIDNGANWNTLGVPSAASSRLLAADAGTTRLYFKPSADFNGTISNAITFRAWDQTSGTNGGVLSTTTNGNATAFSTTTDNVALTITAVNDAPSFAKGADQSVPQNSPAQTVSGWATAITAGPADESAQVLDFIVTNDNNPLFSVQPAVAPNGTLTYTPANGQSGVATVSVSLHDDAGTANSGADTSAIQTFTITVTPLCSSAPIVTSIADAGAGSLRDAITNSCIGAVITFDLPGAGPHTIQLLSALPVISQDLTINGPTNESVTVKGQFVAGPQPEGAAVAFAIFTVRTISNPAGPESTTAAANVSISNLNITGGAAPAGSCGGGILNDHSTLTLTGVTVYANTAAQGAGVCNFGVNFGTTATLNIVNSTISGNAATGEGGGISNQGQNNGNTVLNVTNATIAGNNATAGAGIYNYGNNNGNGTTNLKNTILANGANGGNLANLTTGGAGGIVSQGHNLSDDAAGGDVTMAPGGFLSGAGDIRNGTTALGALAFNGGPTQTRALLNGSLAVDNGIAVAGITTDQRGISRPVDFPGIANGPGGDGSDIGSVEMQVNTAGEVSLSGRVVTAAGRGITNANVTVYGGSLAAPITIVTRRNGTFYIEGLTAGETYVIAIASRRYYFETPTRVITLNDSATGVDFVARQ